MQSHPMRVRGLKLRLLIFLVSKMPVAPYAGA